VRARRVRGVSCREIDQRHFYFHVCASDEAQAVVREQNRAGGAEDFEAVALRHG
jgi:hypothetical protein